MGIVTIIAVVTQNKVVILRYFFRGESVVGRLFNVRLVQWRTININYSRFYLYCVAGYANDALNKRV